MLKLGLFSCCILLETNPNYQVLLSLEKYCFGEWGEFKITDYYTKNHKSYIDIYD